MGSNLKSFAKQTAVYGFMNILSRFLNYLLVPLYTYTFNPNEYGIVTEFYSYAVILQILLTYGLETAFFRYSKENENIFATFFLSLLVSSTFFIFFVYIFRLQIAKLLGYTNALNVLLLALILYFDTLTVLFFAKLRIENKAFKFAVIKLANVLLNIFFNLFFLVLLPYLSTITTFVNIIFVKYDIGISYVFLSNLLASFFTFLYFLPALFNINFNFDKNFYLKALSYSFPLLISGLIGAFNETIDRIMLKYFYPGSHNEILYQLGLYGANTKLAIIIIFFVQAFRFAAEPFLFAFKNKNDFEFNLSKILNFYLLVSVFIFIFVYCNLDILKYFISPEYFSGLNILYPYMLSRFFFGLFFITSFWYKFLDKNTQSLPLFVLSLVLNIVLNLILLPVIGTISVAINLALGYFLITVASLIKSKKHLNITLNYVLLILSMLFLILVKFLDYLPSNFSLFWTLFIKNLFLLSYLLVMFYFNKNYSYQFINFVKNLVWRLKL